MALAQLQLLVKVQQEKEDKLQAQYRAAQQNYQSMQQKYQGLADYRIEYVQQTQSRGQQGMASRQFNQYLNFKNIPVLELKQEGDVIKMRWKTNVKFEMPIKLENTTQWIYPTNQWTVIKTDKALSEIEVDKNFYVEVKK